MLFPAMLSQSTLVMRIIIMMIRMIITTINNNNDINDNDSNIERHSSRILTVSSLSHWAANCLQHVYSSGQSAIMCKPYATHWALITCSTSFAMWCEGTAQLLSLTKLRSQLFLGLFHCLFFFFFFFFLRSPAISMGFTTFG